MMKKIKQMEKERDKAKKDADSLFNWDEVHDEA